MQLHDCGLESGWAVLLRDTRLDMGLSQRELAGRIGVSASNLSYWELGYKAPHTFAKWNRWARACGLPGIIPLPPQYRSDDDELS